MNTKKQLLALGLFISLISLPILARAENSANGDRPNTPKDPPVAREVMKKDKIKLFGEKAVLRLTAALNRADGFRQRVAFHISQFPNPKFDPLLANQKLEEASTSIAQGRLAVTAIQTALDATLAQTGTESSFTTVRAKVREAMTAIRAAHQKIIEAIRLIKASYGEPPEKPTATTSSLSN